MIYFSLAFFLLAIISKSVAQLSFSPTGPYCDGDTVTFTCILVPAGDAFTSFLADIRFTPDPSTTCYSRTDINNNNTGPINSTRYTHLTFVPGISLPNASAVLEINPFQTVDASIPFSCCVPATSAVFFSNSVSPIPLAAPPSAASISISTTYNPADSCTGTITLTWLAVTSDRAVTSYEVLLNGTNIDFINPIPGTNSYTTNALNLISHYATYTVMATSCAGSSTSSPVIFIPPNPPNSFTPNINCTRLNQLTNQAELNISLPTVNTDRPITHYTLYINNILENTISADGSNYEYSTILQLSSYSNLNITTLAYSCAGFSSITITDICVGDVPPALSTGAIVGIVVGGACFIIIVIAVILLCCILIYFATKRKARSDQEERKK